MGAQTVSLADKIARSLFVALAVGLAWGIRGDFGHLVGAMYPGAILAMALAYVSGQRALFLWMPTIAAASGLAIGSGGMMSYGILHGLRPVGHADQLRLRFSHVVSPGFGLGDVRWSVDRPSARKKADAQPASGSD